MPQHSWTRLRLLVVGKGAGQPCHPDEPFHDQPDLWVSGVAGNLTGALLQLGHCDVVVVAATLPDNGACRLIGMARQSHPGLAVLVTGAREDGVLRFIEAGAAGYALAGDSPVQVATRIRSVARGQPMIEPKIVAGILGRITELSGAEMMRRQAERPALTLREQEVLQLLARGASNEQIARRLAIETGTVKNHMHSIFRKLGVSKRAQAAALAPIPFSVEPSSVAVSADD